MTSTRLNPEYLQPYKAGDTITGTLYAGGFVTSGGTEFLFTIPLTKPVSGQLSITSMSLIVRQNGKYLVGSGSAWVDVTNYTSYSWQTVIGMIASVRMPSAPTGVTNNDSIGVQVNYTLTVS